MFSHFHFLYKHAPRLLKQESLILKTLNSLHIQVILCQYCNGSTNCPHNAFDRQVNKASATSLHHGDGLEDFLFHLLQVDMLDMYLQLIKTLKVSYLIYDVIFFIDNMPCAKTFKLCKLSLLLLLSTTWIDTFFFLVFQRMFCAKTQLLNFMVHSFQYEYIFLYIFFT